jgi:hypothetical protein
MAPSGIDPATFRFTAQCLNYCATACPSVLTQMQVTKYITTFQIKPSHISKHQTAISDALRHPVRHFSVRRHPKLISQDTDFLLI